MIVILNKQKIMIAQLRHERRLLKFQLKTAKAKLARAKSSPLDFVSNTLSAKMGA